MPPLTNGRPSGRTTIPLQNISHASDWVTSVSSCGSQTAAWYCVTVGTLPEPDTISTLPLFMRARWIGLIGIGDANVRHCPCTPAWARIVGANTATTPRASRLAPAANHTSPFAARD